jgi:hypothetical protein
LSPYVFPGYPNFLESAAAELGRPESSSLASRIAPLTALANLCAQAAQSDRAHVEGILAKATEFRDQLAVALRAAELMLADVQEGRSRSLPEARVETETLTTPDPMPDPRGGRKGPRTSREPS